MRPSRRPTIRVFRSPRILIIDDEQIFRRSLEDLLIRWGYDAVGAATAAEGLQRAAEWRPEVALVDLHLPDMSGRELVARLRGGMDPPAIVVLTGDVFEPVDGTVAMLHKPFRVGELLELIARHTSD